MLQSSWYIWYGSLPIRSVGSLIPKATKFLSIAGPTFGMSINLFIWLRDLICLCCPNVEATGGRRPVAAGLDVVFFNTFYQDIINLRYSNMLFIFIIKVN